MQSDGLRPAHAVQLHTLQGGAILFDDDAQRLYHLNGVAACIWRHIEGDVEPALAVRRIAESLAVDEATALAYLRNMTAQWSDLNLLTGRRPRREEQPAGRQPAVDVAAGALLAGSAARCRRHYAVLGTTVRVCFPDERLEADAHSTLRHLEVPTSRPADLTMHVLASPGGYEIRHEGRLLDSCESLCRVVPSLNAHLFHLAVKRFPHLIALHSGAVTSSQGCLLLPAASGSGKSTLTAGLVRGGWRYMADDIVLLQHGSLSPMGVPNALGLKAGVWHILGSRYPEVAALPVYERADGRRVRYLAPSRCVPPAPNKEPAVRWVVFPCYGSGSPAEMRPLNAGDGLCRLMAHCCGMPARLTQEDVHGMVRWIEGVACCELRFSDLDAAIEAVRSVTAPDTRPAGRSGSRRRSRLH